MEFFASLFHSLEHLGVYAYMVIFLIAFFDSLIIIGTFTAGAAFLFFAGVLAARGVYGLPELILFSAIGAMLGGAVSFYLGRAEANFARRKHWFPKEKHLDRGARMLAKRGGFSILIARFLGPLSSVMAFVAGTVKMPQHRFHFWNGLSGILWSASFILLGYILTSSLSHFEVF